MPLYGRVLPDEAGRIASCLVLNLHDGLRIVTRQHASNFSGIRSDLKEVQHEGLYHLQRRYRGG